ncbi:hypothetical protein SRABI106_03140 [Rahnella aquatilis]|nr:hypothetical protein SRABI106_03140 [Rahnella aquatilis]
MLPEIMHPNISATVARQLACNAAAAGMPNCFCNQVGVIRITTTIPADNSQVISIDTTISFL